MYKNTHSIGLIHFVGIGGIGMSGIAEILHNLGYQVQGSDASQSPNVERLQKSGIKVYVGHKAEQIEDAKVLVISSAIKTNNPELLAAREKRIPIIKRAEMLAELMRLKNAISIGGSHGKTTTTSLVARMLEQAGLDPTVINGGIINSYNSNAYLGASDWMVVESDESDGSFTRLPSFATVVTNIDPEHLDHYGTFDKLKDAFDQFVNNVPFYGFSAVCIDHPEVKALYSRVTDKRLVTYGFSPQAEVRAQNIRSDEHGFIFDVVFSTAGGFSSKSSEIEKDHVMKDVVLPMFGEHNVLNALASIVVAREIGITEKVMKQALSTFSGVKRRFTITGRVQGVTIVDDYGHHPVEIAAVLKAARQATKHRVIAIIQPHRYTRLSSLFEGFCSCCDDADMVVVADVYSAGEDPIEGATKERLIDGLRQHGHKHVIALNNKEELCELIAAELQEGDFVIFLGAGTSTYWAHEFPEQLTKFYKSKSGSQTNARKIEYAG